MPSDGDVHEKGNKCAERDGGDKQEGIIIGEYIGLAGYLR